MYEINGKKRFPINQKGMPAVPFVVPKGTTYVVIPLGYLDKLGNQIFDPLDIGRVKITRKGELLDGTQIFMAENGCDCGVHVEVG